jgi:hypothetical protein
MADNINVTPSADGSAVAVATDDVSGVHYPVYKPAFGADGTVTLVSGGSPMPVTDYLQEVAQGNIPGHSLVHKYGRNPAVQNGTDSGLLQVGNNFIMRQSATTFRIKAGGNAADDASGLGSQSVFIQGISAALTEDINELTSAGASASGNSTTSFWRIHRTWSGPVGTYGGSNTGEIIIEDSAGVADHISIGAGEGQSQYLAFTIPTGKTGYFVSFHANIETSKSVDLKVWTRANFNDVTTPFSPSRLKLYFVGRSDKVDYEPKTPEFSMPALTDVWVTGKGIGATADITGNFEILLVDD